MGQPDPGEAAGAGRGQEQPAGGTTAGTVGDVGVNFIDILFALVVGQIFVALNRAPHLSAAGKWHLVFAAVLTITSWLGYHRSRHRFSTGTFNLCDVGDLLTLLLFTLDIGLVFLYWLAVTTTEGGFTTAHQRPSWRWTVGIAVAVFGIYVLWDLIGWLRVRLTAPGKKWRNQRRVASVIGLGLAAAVLGVAIAVDPRSSDGVAVVDAILTVVALVYRFAKDTPMRGPWQPAPPA